MAAIAAQPVQAAGRVPLTGQVSLRCWAPASAGVTPEIGSSGPSRSQGSPVRCNGSGSQVRVENRPPALVQSRVVSGQSQADAVIVTVSPNA